MTFGEHLEELRRALARAILWLVAGGLIALFLFAKPVVRWIQVPLEQAIIQYKADKSVQLFGDEFSDASESDEARLEALNDFMVDNGVSFQRVWVFDSVSQAPPEAKASEPKAAQPAATDAAGDNAAPVDSEPPAVTGDTKATKEPGKSPAKTTPDKVSPESPSAEKTTAGEKAAASNGDEAGDQPADKPATPLPGLTRIPTPEDFTQSWILFPTEAGLNSHKVEEPFMIYLKASVVIGSVIASPMIFYHIWGFVAAGLYPHERKYVYLYLPFSVVLFVAGVSIAFFAVLGFVLQFLLDFNSTLAVDIEPRLSYYMNFVLLLPLGFGIAFQLPLVMLFLQRIGLIETSAFENSWRIAVLVIALLSMVLTPADPYSMILLMCPLIFLYFLGIGLCRYMPRGRGLGSTAYDPR